MSVVRVYYSMYTARLPGCQAASYALVDYFSISKNN